MPYQLKGRNVFVTASSRGLGSLIIEKFAAQGCNVAINYHSSKDCAESLAEEVKAKFGVKAILVQGDTGVHAECERMVKDAKEGLGGLDVLVSNAGWTKFSEFGDLSAQVDEDWDKCFQMNVKSHLHLFTAAAPTFNANPDGGVFLITASVAGIAVSGSSMAYSVTKAACLQLMRCLAETQGPKIRVNAVLPGLLLTEWGQKFPKAKVEVAKAKAALKDVTDLDDCAEAFVSAAKNSSMTGQKIQVDAGLFI